MSANTNTELVQRAAPGLRWAVFALFFVSGATALVYQIPWVRNLTLTFGASHEAVGIVLAAFMGGLAIGGFVFGRLSERVRRPLRLYGLLELGIGVMAFLLPTLLRLVDGIYISAALETEGVSPALQLMRVGLAFGVLLLPTILMGGTLPVLAKLMVSRSTEFGLRLSQLYAINTLGAVTGAVVAGVVMLPNLGVQATVWVAVGLNLVVGALALAVDRRLPALEPAGAEPASPGEKGKRRAVVTGALEVGALGTWALRLTFLGTAVSGMCALALEVMWTRSLSVAVGQTTYSFTVILAAFLLGIGLGSWLHSLLPLERFSISAKFGVVLSGVGLSSLVVSQWIPELPMVAVRIGAAIDPGAGGRRLGTTLLSSFVIMLVPCVLMGMAFPLAGQARAKLRQRFGEAVGDVVALNTLGAIAGSLLAAFVLVPRLGLQRGTLLVAAVDLAYGLLVVAFALAGGGRRRTLAPLCALLALGALALPFTLPEWDLRQLATFVNNTHQSQTSPEELAKWREARMNSDVIYYREGMRSNVSVIQSDETRAILIDGKSVASDSVTDMQHELLLGHLPVLMHPNPRTAAVVGLGAGITLGGVLAHPDLEQVVLVEIEPAVIDGARKFAHVNDDALDDPRLEIAIQDGRNFMRTANRKFDVITADPIHPWAQGAAYLYTTEYFGIVAEKLTPGGVMCQWLPLYELSGENIRSVIASFSDSFPFTTLWQTSYDALLLGSDTPLTIDPADLERRLKVVSVRRQLAPIGLADALSFLSELTLNYEDSASFGAGAPRNTDDSLYLEFSSPLSIATPEVVTNIRDLDELRAPILDIVPDLSSILLPGVSQEVACEAFRSAKSVTVKAQIDLQSIRSSADTAPYPAILEELTELVGRLPDYGRARSLLCLAWTQYGIKLKAAGQEQQRLLALSRAVEVMPRDAEANFQLATALTANGQAQASLPYFEAATAARRKFGRALTNYGSTLNLLGRHAEAVERLRSALELRPSSATTRQQLGLALTGTGLLAEAEEAFESALELDPGLSGLHLNYGSLLVTVRRFDEAQSMLEDGLALWPGDPRLSRSVSWLLATAPSAGLRDGERALRLAQEVDRATGGRIPQVLDTVAAALAEAGQLERAAVTAERAAQLARESGQAELAAEIDARAAGYRAGQPHRL